ncbi:MAG TPA: arginine decarboxylase, partial [Roseiflexaceae bacterium]|nr:arginine decarboxylase [Roseiflexaceae bacterium]
MTSFFEQTGLHVQADGRLNDFLAVRDRRVLFDGVDLLALVERLGAPLEVSFCPRITTRVRDMQAIFARARADTGYPGEFVYAYATKSNFAEEVVRTAMTAGAHYETSSAFDVRIAQRLWRGGILPAERFIFCNGSKEPAYIRAIVDLREAGFANIVPILDDIHELEALSQCREPLLLGVRERKDAGDIAEGATYGYDRFGLLPDEMQQVAERLRGTPHRLILYHAMVGSQLEDADFFLAELRESLAGYAR